MPHRSIPTVVLLSCFLLLLSACRKEQPEPGPVGAASTGDGSTVRLVGSTHRHGPYNQLFTRYSGWTGGDQGYSISLPDGRVLWLFGDSFFGAVNPDRSRPPGSQFVRNGYLVQNGAQLTELNPHVNGQWLPVVSPANPAEWYWPGDGFVSGNMLYIFQQRMALTDGGPNGFNFGQTGVDVSLFSLPGLQLQGVQPFNDDPEIDWGTAVMEDGPFLYIYGTESVPYNKFAHVSRTALNAPFQQMQYWDGTNWTNDPQSTARVRSGLSQSFSLFKHGGKYYLLSQENILGPDIFIWDAVSPVGPFVNKRKLYVTPQPAGTWTYNALAHPHTITAQGDLLLCYSINAMDFWRILDNADLYRPIFLRARGWE
ncbi:MAG: DUF5005 domain-containing protein [Flavobacteriales bacterium]|nr:DUF5005 domain-containing protein [Flavobacteriales bacterium]MBP9081311.1 DUF5005 domain-containing protein [Flavobacteriales bacterium]